MIDLSACQINRSIDVVICQKVNVNLWQAQYAGNFGSPIGEGNDNVTIVSNSWCFVGRGFAHAPRAAFSKWSA